MSKGSVEPTGHLETNLVAGAAPFISRLDDERALQATLVGAKAANLARAADRGLPVLPGFTVTTAATDCGALAPAALAAVRTAWEQLTATEKVPRGAIVVPERGRRRLLDGGPVHIGTGSARVVGVPRRRRRRDRIGECLG